MTTAMHNEYSTSDTNASLLQPGTLIYLWAPEQEPWRDGSKPINARVRRVNVDTIEAVNLADGSEGLYDVSRDKPAHLRCSWEVYASPQQSCAERQIVAADPDLAERTRFVAGDVGAALRISLRSGEQVHGRLTKLVMGQDAWEAEWAELEDIPPGRDIAVHVIRVSDISKVTRFRRA